MKYFRYYWSCFRRGIKNLVYWFPVIWRNRNWNDYHLHAIMLHKIEEKIKFFQSDECYSARSEEVVEQLTVVKEALKRVVDDDYYELACKTYNIKDPYDFEKIDNETMKDIIDLEDKLKKADLEKVYSRSVSEQIEGWWD